MIRYIYQRSSHNPPWAISYETEYVRSIRTLKVYATVYSDEIDNKRHAAYFEVMGKTPFAIAHMIQSFLEDHNVTFDENDFNQIEWEFSRYF